MSNHPDTLIAYVKWFGKVTENISSAELTAIDSKVSSYCLSTCRNFRTLTVFYQSMTLTYNTQDRASQVVIIPIKPPLAGYEEVKNRLLGMKAEAQEGLGMVRMACPS
jgi:hypothetical protein